MFFFGHLRALSTIAKDQIGKRCHTNIACHVTRPRMWGHIIAETQQSIDIMISFFLFRKMAYETKGFWAWKYKRPPVSPHYQVY